jgi:threonine/homoserine/homoserine lactone efflux protein
MVGFWFGFLDLFIGTTKGHWIWTLGVISAFFFAEGVAKLALWVYLRLGNQELRKANEQKPSQNSLRV